MIAESKKIITFRAGSLGDSLMGKYLLENIYITYPKAHYYLVVPRRGEMVRSLLTAYPWIKVIEASRRKPIALIKALFILWRADITILQSTSQDRSSTIVKLFSRIVTKKGGLVGFDDVWKHNHKLFDITLKHDEDMAIFLHEQDVLRALGIPITKTRPIFAVVEDKAVSKKFGFERDSYIILNLFSGSEGRGLSPENMKKHARGLKNHIGSTYGLVLTGGAENREFIDSLAKEIGAVSVAGRTSIQELGNIIKDARAVVSVDTGVAHMASGLGKPLVVLVCYQAANWWMRPQYGDNVTVLMGELGPDETKKKGNKFPHSLNSITSQEVIAALDSKLSNSGYA